MFRLSCSVQSYAWGKLGNKSEIGSLCEAAEPDFTAEELQPYAELWMGTHPKGPSKLYGTGGRITLAEWLKNHPEAIGEKLKAAVFSENSPTVQLPYLFKVLSVNKTLSIQSHPTKEQAKKLHAEFPQHYPDENHKPEMCIALSPFELLCGFRPPNEIVNNIKAIPELFELVSGPRFQGLQDVVERNLPANSEVAKAALKACFERLLKQPCPLVEKNVNSVAQRIALIMNTRPMSDMDYVMGELIIRLNYHFPGDVGCFSPFFLNHFVLQPGECCFLGPNEPHAYLYGDCIECMACSDNTIRAGLTPKYKDVNTLCESLTYRMAAAEQNKFSPQFHPKEPTVKVYKPPAPEFCVYEIQVLENGQSSIMFMGSCSLLIVIKGSAKVLRGSSKDYPISQLSRGMVVFIPANRGVDILLEQTPFVAYRAFTDENCATQLSF